MKKRVEIKKSRNGLGIFTLQDFSKNEILFDIKGKLISCDIEEDLDEKTRDNTIRFNRDLYLSPKGLGEYINHSCDPNTAIIKRTGVLYVRAICNIKKDEEVVFDYSTILSSDDVWQLECNCGSSLCRKVIKQFRTLPKATKEKYKSLGMVPRYIV